MKNLEAEFKLHIRPSEVVNLAKPGGNQPTLEYHIRGLLKLV